MNASNTSTQIKSLLVQRTADTILPYLNCHPFIIFVVVFTLVDELVPCSDLLVC